MCAWKSPSKESSVHSTFMSVLPCLFGNTQGNISSQALLRLSLNAAETQTGSCTRLRKKKETCMHTAWWWKPCKSISMNFFFLSKYSVYCKSFYEWFQMFCIFSIVGLINWHFTFLFSLAVFIDCGWRLHYPRAVKGLNNHFICSHGGPEFLKKAGSLPTL